MKSLNNLKIGYLPCSYLVDRPDDRRRFYYFAKEDQIKFELFDSKSKYDLVVLTQNSDIGLLPSLKENNTKVVYDCIDSYISDELSFKGRLRGLAKFLNRDTKKLYLNYAKTLRKKLSEFDAIICASEEQRLKLLDYSNNVHAIPDMLNDGHIETKRNYDTALDIKIVWEGLGTNAFHLRILKKVLHSLSNKYNLELHLVTDPFYFKHMNRFNRRSTLDEVQDICNEVFLHKWEKDTFSKIIIDCDLAIIPLNNKNALAFGKPENKLISLWKMGMPVITTNTDSYKRVMKEAKIDLHCNDEADWVRNINSLIESKDLRQKVAKRGLEYSEEHYSKDVVLGRWRQLFSSLI